MKQCFVKFYGVWVVFEKKNLYYDSWDVTIINENIRETNLGIVLASSDVKMKSVTIGLRGLSSSMSSIFDPQISHDRCLHGSRTKPETLGLPMDHLIAMVTNHGAWYWCLLVIIPRIVTLLVTFVASNS